MEQACYKITETINLLKRDDDCIRSALIFSHVFKYLQAT